MRPGMELAGDYFCSQGWTRMRVTVNRVEDVSHVKEGKQRGIGRHKRLLATLDFLTTNNVEGTFMWQGTWNLDTNIIDLKPERWLEQPPGFTMVSVVGSASHCISSCAAFTAPGPWSSCVSVLPPRESCGPSNADTDAYLWQPHHPSLAGAREAALRRATPRHSSSPSAASQQEDAQAHAHLKSRCKSAGRHIGLNWRRPSVPRASRVS